jgi:hypothetical protein
VSVLLGNGDGTFAPNVDFDGSTNPSGEPTSVAVADFNLDGKADIAASCYYSDTVSVLLGGGCSP